MRLNPSRTGLISIAVDSQSVLSCSGWLPSMRLGIQQGSAPPGLHPLEAARLFRLSMRFGGSLFFYRRTGCVRDCNAWRAVRDVAGDTGHHLPIVGSAFRVPDQVKTKNSWMVRVRRFPCSISATRRSSDNKASSE